MGMSNTDIVQAAFILAVSNYCNGIQALTVNFLVTGES